MKLARVRHRGRVTEARLADGALVVDGPDGEERLDPGQAELLPVSEPSKILAIGWNFPKHIDEMKGRFEERAVEERPAEPLVFFKPPSALVSDGEPIVFPRDATRVEYEGELVCVIGTRCRRVSPEEALGYVRGWACGNDVTERDMQRRDKQWWRAKGYDSFAAVGRILETGAPPPAARIETRVNGEVRQEGRVGDMLFDPPTIISFVSQVLTLEPGDLIMLGTPPGVGPLEPGDEVSVFVEGVGTLTNPVIAED